MYRTGQGVDQDAAEAAKWYRQAADQGHAQAQANLGFMYATGQGVEQNDTQAANWYRRAANQDDAQAQYNLALRYARGQGTPLDYGQAYMWISLAETNASGEHKNAVLKVREYIVALMEPEQIEEGEELFRKRQRSSSGT